MSARFDRAAAPANAARRETSPAQQPVTKSLRRSEANATTPIAALASQPCVSPPLSGECLAEASLTRRSIPPPIDNAILDPSPDTCRRPAPAPPSLRRDTV